MKMQMPLKLTIKVFPLTDHLSTWLRRSKETRLAINLSEGWAALCMDALQRRNFRPLMDTAPRWSYLEVSGGLTFRHLLSLLEDSLVLKGEFTPGVRPSQRWLEFPSLRSCLFVDDIPRFSFRASLLSVLQLKNLYITSRQLNSLTSGAPNVENLVLDEITWLSGSNSALEELSFPKLLSLDFNVIPYGSTESRNRTVLQVLHRLLLQASHLRFLKNSNERRVPRIWKFGSLARWWSLEMGGAIRERPGA
jgi:hypothetical protein